MFFASTLWTCLGWKTSERDSHPQGKGTPFKSIFLSCTCTDSLVGADVYIGIWIW